MSLHKDFSKVLKINGIKETDAILSTKVTDLHALDIADAHCSEWASLLVVLGIENSSSVKKDIEKKHVGDAKEQRKEFFEVWKKQKGKEATYKVLINALLQIKQRSDAEYICNLLKDSTDANPQESEGIIANNHRLHFSFSHR